ncbi:HIT family protein [Streptomyces erythrochromogenes]|uniref:HIT family protein n=1 Tax=Streptomyces erythrochromogenes TaxID=285574 RepID=UPI0036A69AA7
MPTNCVFCDIAAGRAPAAIVRRWSQALAIVPLSPVTPGHLLVLPYEHVTDAGSDPLLSALTMAAASELVAELPSANILTSKGRPATQSTDHLHLHVLPRCADDGLVLPWSLPLCIHADTV